MAYTTIDDPSAYFHVNLHSGNGTNNTDITFDANAGDFQPDWVWFKGRTSSAIDHALFDSSRGTTKILSTNNTSAENAQGASLKAFNSNGFRVGDDAGDYGVNASGRTYVTWNWKANGGTTSSNSDGSITSTVQANTTAGFSIVTYTGNGTNGAFVGHGLGVTPNIVIIKNRSASDAWRVGFSAFSNDLVLNDTSASAAYSAGRIGGLSSTKFELGGSGSFDSTNVNGENYVAYCFAPIQGYSKFGSYTGNGNADGTFVYTGFRPSWVMAKRTDSAANWMMFDTKRDTFNVMDSYVVAHASQAEADFPFVDFLSNGFKWRHTSGHANASGGTYIYMAFAEHPFVSSEGVPTTAR